MARKRKRSSRPIVSGYLEKVSADIFDRYKEEIISVIAGHQGIYALYDKNKLHNVGFIPLPIVKTENMRI